MAFRELEKNVRDSELKVADYLESMDIIKS